MKSDEFIVQSNTESLNDILNEVEKVAAYESLDDKQSLQLRLLTEELINMQKALLGFSSGKIYIENKGNEYKIVLHADILMDEFAKERFIDVSTNRRNEAYRGASGKVRMVMDSMMNNSVSTLDSSGITMSPVFMLAQTEYDNMWSFSEYADSVEENTEAWDELEHSILAKLADEIYVASRNNYVELIIVKKF